MPIASTASFVSRARKHALEERRREFFPEGRRLWEIRRFALPLTPAPGAPYVVGGGVYGDRSCFPLPAVERNNNPNIAGT